MADAAIQVAGAAAGAPLVNVSQSGGQINAVENDAFQTETETLASAQSRLEREKELRQWNISLLQSELRNKMTRLSVLDASTPADQPEIQALIRQITISLKARRAFLEHPAP